MKFFVVLEDTKSFHEKNVMKNNELSKRSNAAVSVEVLDVEEV